MSDTTVESFSCWLPAQIVSKGGKKDGKRWIQGIASTSSRDLQGEVVSQKGIDVSYFLKRGYFNDDHKPGPENKVGEPTEAKITKEGLWVKGFLYDSDKSEKAKHIWNLMKTQEETPGAQRKMGFSIEGKVKRRKGNTIESCWIQDVAITTAPVNGTTWAEIAKSLSAQPWVDSSEDDDPEAEKAMTTASPVAKVESLEGKLKVTKSLTYSETVSYIQQRTGYTEEQAMRVAKSLFNMSGLKE